MVQREEYLAKLEAWREKQLIKVISGVRRCGKSTLLMQFIKRLKDSGVNEDQIIFINLEDPEFEDLLNHHSLYEYIKKNLSKNKCTYIFIDEVQQCIGFEKAIDGLFIKKNVDLYVTGSNAYLLSGELATLLSGRYIEINMLPLSFAEYLKLSGHSGNNAPDFRLILNDYIRFGSFPYAAILGADEGLTRTYIDGIYSTILLKDVAKRTGSTDISLLENIIKFLSHSVGSPISAKKICDTLKSSGRKISVNTVDMYLRNLTDSFIFYYTGRYDIKGRQHLKTLGKYYIVDTGIRNMLLESSSPDLGHQLENIVYLELLRRGCRVSTGKLDEAEVDFVVSGVHGADGTGYYQVAASVLDPDTLARELSSLRKINDNHPKYLLTLDDIPSRANHDGIIQMYLIDWLLDRNPKR
ncbi:MAG: ATP-binding protein [Treponema sp.]|nr:ATP-binding protein [Treponema sp.]